MTPKPIEPPVHDEVAHLIAWHDGDARAAIRTLLDDCRRLHAQLQLAALAMGHGYTRGWKPIDEFDFDRADDAGASTLGKF